MFYGHAPLTSSTVGLHSGSFAFPYLATYGTRSLVWREKRAGEKNFCLEVGESVTRGIFGLFCLDIASVFRHNE